MQLLLLLFIRSIKFYFSEIMLFHLHSVIVQIYNIQINSTKLLDATLSPYCIDTRKIYIYEILTLTTLAIEKKFLQYVSK